jgi:hypothetical protein
MFPIGLLVCCLAVSSSVPIHTARSNLWDRTEHSRKIDWNVTVPRVWLQMMGLRDRVGSKSQVPAAAANLRLWVGQGAGVLKTLL